MEHEDGGLIPGSTGTFVAQQRKRMSKGTMNLGCPTDEKQAALFSMEFPLTEGTCRGEEELIFPQTPIGTVFASCLRFDYPGLFLRRPSYILYGYPPGHYWVSKFSKVEGFGSFRSPILIKYRETKVEGWKIKPKSLLGRTSMPRTSFNDIQSLF